MIVNHHQILESEYGLLESDCFGMLWIQWIDLQDYEEEIGSFEEVFELVRQEYEREFAWDIREEYEYEQMEREYYSRDLDWDPELECRDPYEREISHFCEMMEIFDT